MASGNGNSTRYLNLIGVDIPKVGYGKMVQGLRQALSEKITFNENAEHTIFALRPNLIKGWHKTQTPHLLTMWETNWLPPEFSNYLKEFKTVTVPSMHNWELFSQFHDSVHVIPLGVDRTVWKPKTHEPTSTFKLLCGGSEWYRKGLDVVLEVFNKLQLPDAELHIKIVPPHLFAPKDLSYPNVVVHREWMTVEEEYELVTSADAFISVSRGEGFGLMPLQAISAGVPTILSDAHGHKEFSDLATHRIPATSVPTSKGVWQDMGDWDEPNPEAIAEAIKDIYNNRTKYHKKAELTAPQSAAFNWDTAAKQLIQIVKPTGVTVKPDWQPFEPRCDIQVLKRIKADIGAHRIDFKPGITYNVVLNIRDVLKTTGNLMEIQ